jgi:hypothetical protein
VAGRPRRRSRRRPCGSAPPTRRSFAAGSRPVRQPRSRRRRGPNRRTGDDPTARRHRPCSLRPAHRDSRVVFVLDPQVGAEGPRRDARDVAGGEHIVATADPPAVVHPDPVVDRESCGLGEVGSRLDAEAGDHNPRLERRFRRWSGGTPRPRGRSGSPSPPRAARRRARGSSRSATRRGLRGRGGRRYRPPGTPSRPRRRWTRERRRSRIR